MRLFTAGYLWMPSRVEHSTVTYAEVISAGGGKNAMELAVASFLAELGLPNGRPSLQIEAASATGKQTWCWAAVALGLSRLMLSVRAVM